MVLSKINDLEKMFKEREKCRFWIDFSEYEDINGCYLMVGWKDWETEEDFEKRMLEFEKKFQVFLRKVCIYVCTQMSMFL